MWRYHRVTVLTVFTSGNLHVTTALISWVVWVKCLISWSWRLGLSPTVGQSFQLHAGNVVIIPEGVRKTRDLLNKFVFGLARYLVLKFSYGALIMHERDLGVWESYSAHGKGRMLCNFSGKGQCFPHPEQDGRGNGRMNGVLVLAEWGPFCMFHLQTLWQSPLCPLSLDL